MVDNSRFMRPHRATSLASALRPFPERRGMVLIVNRLYARVGKGLERRAGRRIHLLRLWPVTSLLLCVFAGCANRGMHAPLDGGRELGSADSGGTGGAATDSGTTGVNDGAIDVVATGAGGDAGNAGGRADAAGLGGAAAGGMTGTAGSGGGEMPGAAGAGGAGGGAEGGEGGTSGSAGASGGTGRGGSSGTGGGAGASGGGGDAGAAGTAGGRGGAGGAAGGGGTGGTDGSAGRGGSGGAAGRAGNGGAGGASPVVISVDFVGGGVAMSATEIAGVVRAARWNSAALSTGSLTSLVASTGAPTTAAVSWNGENVYQLGISEAAGDARMMNGYLDPFGVATVMVTGLPTSFTTRGYDLYVYANGYVPTGQMRTCSYAVGGMTMTLMQAANTPYAGTYNQAIGGGVGNYLVFRNLNTASFTLSATPGPATGPRRSPLNGLQIVALPP
jgi:hypothetical protein